LGLDGLTDQVWDVLDTLPTPEEPHLDDEIEAESEPKESTSEFHIPVG
jgi:hypothetical protein